MDQPVVLTLVYDLSDTNFVIPVEIPLLFVCMIIF